MEVVEKTQCAWGLGALTLGSYTLCFPVSLGWILSARSPTPPSDHCHPLSLAGAGRRCRGLGFVCMSGSISGHGGGHLYPRLAASWCIQRASQSMQAQSPSKLQHKGCNTLGVTCPPWMGVEGKAPGSISPPGHAHQSGGWQDGEPSSQRAT